MRWKQISYDTWARKSDGVIIRFFDGGRTYKHYSYGSCECDVFTTHPDYKDRTTREILMKNGSYRKYYFVDSFNSIKQAKVLIAKLKKQLNEVKPNSSQH